MANSSKKIQNSEFDQKLREAAKKPSLNSNKIASNPDREPDVIPVIEEQVHIEKDVVETGSVYIYKDVHEEEVSVDIPFAHEEVEIERVPINQYAEGTPPPIRYEGDKMIIPVLKEVLVVEKRTMVVEEIHILKRRVENQESQKINLRREEIKVNREDYNNRT